MFVAKTAMKNSTLAELLAVLLPAELDDFDTFVRSPWCNDYPHPEEQSALIGYLRTAPEPEKAEAYAFVFQGQTFVENKLEKTMSATLKSLRRWIFLRQKNADVEAQMELAAFSSTRGLHDRHHLTVSNARAMLEKKQPQELLDYLLRYLLEYGHTTHLTMHNLKKDDANLNNTLLALDRFYLVARLKNTTLLLAQNLLVPIEMYPVRRFLYALLEEARQHEPLITPLVQLYERLFAMADNEYPSQTNLDGFLDFLARHEHLFSPDTLDTAEIFACNYCTLQYNRSRYDFLPVLFEILLRRLNSGRIYKGKKIRVSDFQLVVVVALRLKKFDWTASFLEEHRGRLFGIQMPEEAWNLNHARYLFYTGEYDRALDGLAATYEELQYKISAKVLEIQIFYEQESPLLDSRLDAAKIFFFREKKLPADKKALYNDFLDMLKQIINPKTLGNRKRVEKLIEKVGTLPGIAERDWVLEKLRALLKKAK